MNRFLELLRYIIHMKKVGDLPLAYEKCPICGCKKTVTQIACEPLKREGKLKKDDFVSLEKVVTPLLQPGLAPTVPAVLVHYDVCAGCGFRYCTKAERIQGVVQVEMPKGFPKNFPLS